MSCPPPVTRVTNVEIEPTEQATVTPTLKDASNNELSWELAKRQLSATVVWDPTLIASNEAEGCIITLNPDDSLTLHNPVDGSYVVNAVVSYLDGLGVTQTLNANFEFIVASWFEPVALSFNIFIEPYNPGP